MTLLRHGLADRIILAIDRGLRSTSGARTAVGTGRDYPARTIEERDMSNRERQHACGLLRVDHAGEVAAQALYHGQALTARNTGVRDAMERSAVEEADHLGWCRDRLDELGGRPSRLDPAWYVGSFVIGAAVGLAGDRWSLGFVAETERQVVDHLDGHLRELPPGDGRSRAILEQMKDDEGAHATAALQAGGAELPRGIKRLMRLTARVMTGTAYWV